MFVCLCVFVFMSATNCYPRNKDPLLYLFRNETPNSIADFSFKQKLYRLLPNISKFESVSGMRSGNLFRLGPRILTVVA